MANKLEKIINFLVESIVNDIEMSGNITVYFDMDGVVADFSGSVHNNEKVKEAERVLVSLLSGKPELLDMHHDDLKELLKGPQEDPIIKKIKKAFHSYRGRTFKVASEPGHFINLKSLPGAREMLMTAKNLTGKLPHILTAPMESNERCEEEKLEWVKTNLTGLYDRFHCTQNKDQFAKTKFDILIDDRPKYVNKFRSAGGSAILHTDPKKSMKELEELITNLKQANE